MCSAMRCRWFAAAGFPIRRSSDQRLYTASRGLSQCPTSFFGIWRQGIHRKLLSAYSRDAEKSILFVLYIRSIQLLMCCCFGGLTPRGDTYSLVRITARQHTYVVFTQYDPAHRQVVKSPHDDTVHCFYSGILLSKPKFTHLLLVLSPGGDEGTRTPGLRRAKAALSHLSYIPKIYLSG